MSHPHLPADGLTKAELAKTSGALEHLLKTGHLTWVQEHATMEQRWEEPHLKLRSRSAAEQFRSESSRSVKEAADDSLENSADAMVAVTCARKIGPLTPGGLQLAEGSRDRWRYAIEQVEDNFTKKERFNVQSRSPLNRRKATSRCSLVESTRKGTSCEF